MSGLEDNVSSWYLFLHLCIRMQILNDVYLQIPQRKKSPWQTYSESRNDPTKKDLINAFVDTIQYYCRYFCAICVTKLLDNHFSTGLKKSTAIPSHLSLSGKIA